MGGVEKRGSMTIPKNRTGEKRLRQGHDERGSLAFLRNSAGKGERLKRCGGAVEKRQGGGKGVAVPGRDSAERRALIRTPGNLSRLVLRVGGGDLLHFL